MIDLFKLIMEKYTDEMTSYQPYLRAALSVSIIPVVLALFFQFSNPDITK